MAPELAAFLGFLAGLFVAFISQEVLDRNE